MRPGKQAGQQAEGLRDLERAVVGEHHPAAAHPDAAGRGGDRTDQRLGAGSGEHRAAVVLGDPVAVIPEPIREVRQVERVVQRLRPRGSLGDRRLVEDGQAKRPRHCRLARGASDRSHRTTQADASDASHASHAVDTPDAGHARNTATVAEPGHDRRACQNAGAQEHPRAPHTPALATVPALPTTPALATVPALPITPALAIVPALATVSALATWPCSRLRPCRSQHQRLQRSPGCVGVLRGFDVRGDGP